MKATKKIICELELEGQEIESLIRILKLFREDRNGRYDKDLNFCVELEQELRNKKNLKKEAADDK